MKKTLIATVLLACIGGWLAWIRSSGPDYANLPPVARGPWVAFGDSLTEGFGASPGQDYPTLLSRELGVPIMNLGRSGETSSDGLARIREVVQLRPRVVLLCLGGNDSLRGERSDVTFSNLASIIDQLHEHGSFVVLIGVHSASVRDKNGERFAQLARERRVLYIPDILQGVLFKPIYMSDGIHPNDEGYKKVAERLAKILAAWVPRVEVRPKG